MTKSESLGNFVAFMDSIEFGDQYRAIKAKMPWLNIFGGCCGSDLRHVTQIARTLVG